MESAENNTQSRQSVATRSRGRGVRKFVNPSPRNKSVPAKESDTKKQKPEPQKKDARDSIEDYKEKVNAGYKDIKLSQFFTEWFEESRKNLNGDISDDFEDKIIQRYITQMEDTDMINSIQQDRKEKRVLKSMESGLQFAVALRLLKTASKTQKTNQMELTKLIDHMDNYQVPAFYNVMLSNIGKFSDENFGNFRIQSPLLKAQQRIIKAMYTLQEYKEEFAVKQDKDIDGLFDQIEMKGFQNFIFDDHDSKRYLKYLAKKAFDFYEGIKFRFKYGDDNAKQMVFTFPKYDLDDITTEQAVEYLKEIETMDSSDPDTTGLHTIKSVRDHISACILFSVIDIRFMNNKKTVAEWNKKFKDISTVKDAKISDVLEYVGLFYAGEYLDVDCMISNAKVIHDFYNDKALSYMIPQMKLVQLDNSEFGNIAQMVETDSRPNGIKNPIAKCMSKFKNHDLVVMGSMFNYVKNIDFKRNVRSVMNISRSNFTRNHVGSDYKFMRK